MPDDPSVLEVPEAFDPPAPRKAAEPSSPPTPGTPGPSPAPDRATAAGPTHPTPPESTAAPTSATDQENSGDQKDARGRTGTGNPTGNAKTAGTQKTAAGAPSAAAGRAAGSPRPRSAALALLTRSWRQLTSMRTALVLLFLLALAAIPGSLIPQRDINPLKVEEYFSDHPTLAPWLDRFSAFGVFGAPWFAAIYLLLFISLIGCLSSRVRWHARALFTAPPKAPARPGRLPGGSTWTSPLDPAEAVLRARGVLRARRFRVAVADGEARRPDGTPDHSAAAEKGYLRETGNLLFHLALVAMLAGVGL
ncbi:cytochrome c biogenesis protein ResB, partial [Frankia sp. EI5c]|uniref:cytochrome c biogenesis protein ResB n=1 Tax=Frankia sp. EI5c TaxID=683316 RepID=UPI0037BF04F2